MKIWIIRDGEDCGPFEKSEIFGFLNSGEVTNEDLARADGSEEVTTVQEIVKNPAGLFSFEQIASLQEEQARMAPATIPDFCAPRRRASTEEEESAGSGSFGFARAALAVVCLLLLAGGIGLFMVQGVNRNAADEPANSSESVDLAATIPDPGPSALLDSTDPSGQVVVAEAADQRKVSTPEEVSLPLAPVNSNANVAFASLPIKPAPALSVGVPTRGKLPASGAGNKAGILSEHDLAEILRERFAATPVKVFDDEEAWSQERATTFKDSFELDTPLKWNPKVKVQYRVPMTSQKRPTPNANHIVLFCTWPGGAAPPPKVAAPLQAGEKPKASLQDSMRAFSDGLGFTAYSLEIVTDRKDMGNKREAYHYAGPEWIDVIRRARAEIVKRHRLKNKKLLIYGPSLGGTFAERVAVAMGDEVGGVAIQNAPEVTLPTKTANTAWFVGITRGDGGTTANAELVHVLRGMGIHCVHAITPPVYDQRGVGNLYHSVSPQARRAAFQFLEAVAARTDSKGENDPTRWPYVRDTARPLMIVRNDREAEQRIPSSRREYMPSREFVHTIQGMPVAMQTVAVEPGSSASAVCFVGVPPLGKPKGVIIIGHKYGYNDLSQLLNNINFLAEKGFVVLSPRLRSNPEKDFQNTLALLGKNRQLAALPLSIIGIGSQNATLWNYLLAQPAIKPVAHVPIDFEPRDLLDESKWPIGRRVQWPLLFLYDQKDFALPVTAEEASASASKLQKVKAFTDSLQQRNQVAAVRFVPVGQKSDEQSAQKNIETAYQFIEASVTGKIRTHFRQ